MFQKINGRNNEEKSNKISIGIQLVPKTIQNEKLLNDFINVTPSGEDSKVNLYCFFENV
jgi:hypothetical protein